MPWTSIKLNDGHSIPSIAFGTWKLGNGQQSIDKVDQAFSTGFDHIDTAQSYRNESEAGQALRDSGLARKDVYITTKYSGTDGAGIETSIQDSLENLGVDYVDLYLIHSPRLAQPDIPTAWAKLEKIKADGLAKSIGVSNFSVAELEILLASAKVKPAANQILFHPYVLGRQGPIIEFGNKHGIVTEAYSPLKPLTSPTGGPLDALLKEISSRLNVPPEQILLSWAKAKGTVVVTSSTKKERLEQYLKAGDLELSKEDIAAIDAAGLLGVKGLLFCSILKRVAVTAVLSGVGFAVARYLGVNVF
ncbi:Aldo/keto reductase [Irpex rosettiformis]|uniref:Aldo/keto reductase n=1 Tax=Irpex rosettiformis TaxID=378272 RepID=A0ACB8U8T6_9APHY|nr:Aldo/keto reductase [Irpex rosettiformis]